MRALGGEVSEPDGLNPRQVADIFMLFSLASLDEFATWGGVMATASHQMMIKYGLGHEPTNAEVARWAALVRKLVSEGSGQEAAGEHAAKQIFTDYRTR